MTKSKKPASNTLKSFVIDGAIFILLIAVTFFFVFKDQDLTSVIDLMKSARPFWVTAGLALMCAYFLIQSWNVYRMLTSLGEKVRFFQILKFTLIEFFFCAVTPSASGGQPVEIYYMSKEKIRGASATMALIVQTCCIQIAIVGLGTLSAFLYSHMLEGGVALLFTFGFLINFVALVVLLACIFSTKLVRQIVAWFFTGVEKLGMKKLASKRAPTEEALDQYQQGSNYIISHKDEFVKSIARVLLQMSCFYLIPYCVYRAFGLSAAGPLELFAMQAILYVATSGLPIPGAVGASESVFFALYGALFGEAMISSAVLLGRGLNFYLFVIIGMLVVYGNSLWLRKRHKK